MEIRKSGFKTVISVKNFYVCFIPRNFPLNRKENDPN